MSSQDGSDEDDILLESEFEDTHAGSLFVGSAFDRYFLQATKSCRTSSNIFSSILPPLTPEAYHHVINDLIARGNTPNITLKPPSFPRLRIQLDAGHNLLLYGAGSKRSLLNNFANYLRASSNHHFHVIVINAYMPNFTLKDLLSSFECLPGILDLPISGNATESRISRIREFITSYFHNSHVYFAIHNIDSPSLRSSKTRPFLAFLYSHPSIHVVASVDDIASPLLWSSREIISRKDAESPLLHSGRGSGGAWLWHDATTLRPYDAETLSADRSSISGGSRSGNRSQRTNTDQMNPARTTLITEVAARHVLLSVTQKAKSLFLLLAQKQTQAMKNVADGAATRDPSLCALEYGSLFNMARDNFVATNDTSLRALLSEFRDHGVVVSLTQGTGNEMVYIPLRDKALEAIISDLEQKKF
ncbi:Origin recognition complex subunit 2 [Abortiporus biennis]